MKITDTIRYAGVNDHTLSLILREILGGSMAVILPKIAPKPYERDRRRKQDDFKKEVENLKKVLDKQKSM